MQDLNQLLEDLEIEALPPDEVHVSFGSAILPDMQRSVYFAHIYEDVAGERLFKASQVSFSIPVMLIKLQCLTMDRLSRDEVSKLLNKDDEYLTIKTLK